MTWLARLKKSSIPAEVDATKATKTVSVAFVAPILASMQEIKVDPAAANDPTTNSETTVRTGLVRSEVRTESTELRRELRTESGPTAGIDDPDYCCWPRSAAMTGSEIDTFTARLSRFTDKGLTLEDSESLADKLLIRDRELDDRRLCLECSHLGGYGHTSWRCGDWQAAGIAIRPRDTQLPADLVLQLQRCDGFATATPNAKANATPNSITRTPF